MADAKLVNDTTRCAPAKPEVSFAPNAYVTSNTNVKFTLPTVDPKKSARLSNDHHHKVFFRRSMTLPSFRKHKPEGTQSTNTRRKLSSVVNESALPSMERADTSGTLREKGTRYSDKTHELNKRPLPPTPDNPQVPMSNKKSPNIQCQEPSMESVAGNKDIVKKDHPSQPKDQEYLSADTHICTEVNCIQQWPLPSSPTTSYTAVPDAVSGPTQASFEPLSSIKSGHTLPRPAHLSSVHNSTQCTQNDSSHNYADTNSATASNDPNFQDHTACVSSSPSVTSLGEIIDKHAEHFPLRIKVLQGYCSEESEQNLSTNDEYTIHFVKHTRIISLKDKDGYTHHIPLASSMKFGLVYNPLNDYNDALIGHQFEKCSDIMAMGSLPKVICSLKTVESTETKSSIHEHEILAVRNIQKSKFRVRRWLKVYSFLTNTDKLLPDDCAGHFTTKPSLICLHLSQIIQGVSNPFPSQAVVYLGAESKMTKNQCNSLSGVITLCDCTTETSLVVSPVVDGCADNEHQFSLPLNSVTSQIEVQPMLCEKMEEFDDTYDDTLTFTKCRDQPYVNLMDVLEPIENNAERETGGDSTYATVQLEMGDSIEQLDSSSEYDTVPFEMNGSVCTADHNHTGEPSAPSSYNIIGR